MPHIQNYAFPEDLCAEALRIWSLPPEMGGPKTPLPPPEALRQLIQTAYLVSLETDEGRPLPFNLYCLSGTGFLDARQDAQLLQSWLFTEPRPFNLQELRRLAAVCDHQSATILVQPMAEDAADNRLEMVGILHVGETWLRSLGSQTPSPSHMAPALLLRIEAPGQVDIYEGRYLRVSLKSGVVTEYISDTEQGLHATATRLVNNGVAALQPLFRKPHDSRGKTVEGPHRTALFETYAYLNVLLSLLNEIQAQHHGGALVLVDEAQRTRFLPHVSFKYTLQHNLALQKAFTEMVNARHAEVAARASSQMAHSHGGHDERSWEQRLRRLAERSLNANRTLLRSCGFLGQLSGADGALVINNHWVPEGFAAEILLENLPSQQVFERLSGVAGERPLNIEQFGMRHRSAMKLCGVSRDAVVFVVSQDGETSLVWNEDGKVCFHRDIIRFLRLSQVVRAHHLRDDH
ncbi:MAG: putative sensor domain DACNV-containing protein [Candidatus Sericytochromatia bacterium]